MGVKEASGQIGGVKWLADTMLKRLKNGNVLQGDQSALDNLDRAAANPKDEAALEVIAQIRELLNK